MWREQLNIFVRIEPGSQSSCLQIEHSKSDSFTEACDDEEEEDVRDLFSSSRSLACYRQRETA